MPNRFADTSIDHNAFGANHFQPQGAITMIERAKLAVGSILLGAILACTETPERALAQGETESTLREDSARLAEMKKEIEAFIGEPRCSQASECAAVGFGSKPCGGHWTYLVYSKMSTDENVLLGRINEYNEYNKVVNERHGLVSDCMLVTEPRIDCVNGLCVIPDKSP